MKELKIFSGRANRPLAEQICQFLNLPLGGIALGNLGRYEEAVKACEKAIEIKPDYERYRKWQAEVGDDGVAVQMGAFAPSHQLVWRRRPSA